MPDDELALRREVEKAARAEAFMRNEVFVEALAAIEKDIWERFKATDPKDYDGLMVQRLRLDTLTRFRANVKSVIDDGKVAQDRLKRAATPKRTA